MGRIRAISCAIALLALPLDAYGATADIPFTGDIPDFCAIVVTQGGTLDPRRNYTRLTSRSGPGIPGRADVTASNTGFTLSVEAPTAFDTEPVGDVSPETFRAWHRSNGATTFGRTRQPRALNAGLSRVRIHMDARKINGSGDVFHAGNYSATVILRCE